jgi:HK97 family phage portal protein
MNMENSSNVKVTIHSDNNTVNSKQIDISGAKRLDRSFKYRKDGLVKPHLPLDGLCTLYKKNSTHYSCVNIKASCISGTGWKLVSTIKDKEILSEIRELENREEQSEEAGVKKLSAKEKNRLQELKTAWQAHLDNKSRLESFFNSINPEMSFQEINENTDIDMGFAGFSCWEIVRNVKGEIKEIWHMPAITVRMMENNLGVCQIKGSSDGYGGVKVFFKKVGNPDLIMDDRTGRIVGQIVERNSKGVPTEITWLDDNGLPDKEAKNQIPMSQWANEVVIFRQYNPDNYWYGMSDIEAALYACAGDTSSAEFNQQFFDNNAVPRMAAIFKGVSLDDDTRNMINDYFCRHIKGQSHKTLFLEVPGEEILENGQRIPGGEIKFEKLATDVTDASFMNYRKDNKDQVAMAHRVPGSLLPIPNENKNKDTLYLDLEIFKSQVIRPKQGKREFAINRHIINGTFGIGDWKYQCNEIDNIDKFRQMQIFKGYIADNVLTINDSRRELGLEPIKGGDIPFRITPLGLVKLEDIEKLNTGDLSARPDKPLDGKDQGGTSGGRPKEEKPDKAPKSQNQINLEVLGTMERAVRKYE